MRRGVPGARLQLPPCADLPNDDVCLENCLQYEAASRSLCMLSAPEALVQLVRWREARAVDMEQHLLALKTPGSGLYIPPARVHLDGATLSALAAATFAPKPLWLSLHLRRNRISRPTFYFSPGASLQRDLEQQRKTCFSYVSRAS